MGERKGTNKYYPPDWTPEKGSLNTYWGEHPLRERARKLDQGILIVRFELPFNIWCGGCGAHLGRGVRYNAEKKAVGAYFSTKIWSFRCKCHLCDHWFEIRTDPKNSDYVIESGARKKEERWDVADAETLDVADDAERQRLDTDPLYKLEHAEQDERKAKASLPMLTGLKRRQKDLWEDNYALSQQLRKKFRERKREEEMQAKEEERERRRLNLDIPLLPPSEEDAEAARRVVFKSQGPDASTAAEKRAAKRAAIRSSSIFASRKRTPGDTPSAALRASLAASPLPRATRRPTNRPAVVRDDSLVPAYK